MAVTKQEITRLNNKARQIRKRIVEVTERCGGSHIGGAMSQTDILVALYYKYLKIDPKKPKWANRDRFILSKGHGGVGHAVILGDLGFFPDKDLDKFNKTGSPFAMHLDRMKVKGVDASTGSLAHGLAIGQGMALGARLTNKKWHTYVVMSDGEMNEGTTWEAAMSGAMFKITNLTAFVDRNMLTIDGLTEEIMGIEPFKEKWEAFGWRVVEIDGHDMKQLCDAIEKSHKEKEKPFVIIAKTVKGKGIDFMEGLPRWHYAGLDSEAAKKAMKSLDKKK